MTDEFNNKKNPEERGTLELELGVLFSDLLRSFSRLWWLVVALAILGGVSNMIRGNGAYVPMYKAEASFTVETQDDT